MTNSNFQIRINTLINDKGQYKTIIILTIILLKNNKNDNNDF